VSATLAGGTFTATVPVAAGDNHLVATAADSLGRTAQAEVVVTSDTTPPVVSIDAPSTIGRLAGATATVSASDNVGLAQVVTSIGGAVANTSTTAPVNVTLTVPASANVGDTVVVTAVATDRAGNTASATQSLRVVGDGVVAGQVLSDVTGLPLAGATATSVASGNSRTDTTDDRGQYSLPASTANVILSISKDGMTSVERQVPIQSGGGTAVVDARLTPIATPAAIGSDGGTLFTPVVSGFSRTVLTIAAGELPTATSL